MTVAELRSRISRYPDNAIVSAEVGDGEYRLITDLIDVGLATGKGTIILCTSQGTGGGRPRNQPAPATAPGDQQ